MVTEAEIAYLAFINTLRREGLLNNIQPERMNLERGIILCVCSDCERFDNIYMFHRELFIRKRLKVRIHVIALNGGALLLPSSSRVVDHCLREDAVMMAHIRAAAEMKDIQDLAMYSHGPYCGGAAKVNQSPTQIFKNLIQAKRRIKREVRAVQRVYAGFHVDYQESRQRSYTVSTKKLDHYLRSISSPSP